MSDRSKILTQILLAIHQYELEIITIDFKNINSTLEEVEVIFRIVHDKFIINYSYTKDNTTEVNDFIRYFKEELYTILVNEVIK